MPDPNTPPDPQATPQATPPTPETPPATERPDWLPEKFKSPEELAKSYAELEKRLGNKEIKEPAPTKLEPQEGGQPEVPPAIDELINQASDAILQGGEITKEIYDKFEKAGIPRSLVDEVVTGRKTQFDQYTQSVKEAAGGDKEWTELSQWAATNISEGEREAFNEAINSGNLHQARLAVYGLKAQQGSYNRSGRDSLKVPGGSGSSGPAGFTSKNEYIAALKDPKYAVDPSYRDSIMMRLRLTPDSVL